MKRNARSAPIVIVDREDAHVRPIKRIKSESAQAVTNRIPVPDWIATSQLSVTLDEQQQEALKLMVEERKNVFLTGSAGSGKSTLIKEVARRLEELGNRVFRTGPTGRAAFNIEGTTLHSYCAWTPKEALRGIAHLERKAESGQTQARFDDTDVLIIDEISMVSNHFFEKLNRVMKIGKQQNSPFGGVQIIVCGDFHQLPPVKPFAACFKCGTDMQKRIRQRQATHRCEPCDTEESDCDKWAFSAQAWTEARFKNIYLEENHRQTERQFIKILDRLRLRGKLASADINLLMHHDSNTDNAIELYPLRREVQEVNKREFDKLPGPIAKYKCLDYFYSSPAHPTFDYRRERSSLGTLKWLDWDQHPYEQLLELKVGMPVLLLANLDVENGLINGSQGTIFGFEDYNESRLPAGRSGMYNSEAEDSMETQRSVFIRGGEVTKLRSEQVLEFITDSRNQDKKWPIVNFSNGRKVTVFADARIDQLGNEPPYTLEGRTQIPLMPVWAMTLHKAQGMSLAKVTVSLANKFEAGQAYVALSRARTLAGLTVKSIGDGFGKSDVDQTVKNFHRATSWDIGKLPVL